MAQRGSAVAAPTPATVPVLPVRNSVIFPDATVPLDISRASSVAAIEAALATQPAFVAIFAQQAIDIDHPTRADLHDNGCLCLVLHRHRFSDGPGEPEHPAAAGPNQGAQARPVAWIVAYAAEVGLVPRIKRVITVLEGNLAMVGAASS